MRISNARPHRSLLLAAAANLGVLVLIISPFPVLSFCTCECYKNDRRYDRCKEVGNPTASTWCECYLKGNAGPWDRPSTEQCCEKTAGTDDQSDSFNTVNTLDASVLGPTYDGHGAVSLDQSKIQILVVR